MACARARASFMCPRLGSTASLTSLASEGSKIMYLITYTLARQACEGLKLQHAGTDAPPT